MNLGYLAMVSILTLVIPQFSRWLTKYMCATLPCKLYTNDPCIKVLCGHVTTKFPQLPQWLPIQSFTAQSISTLFSNCLQYPSPCFLTGGGHDPDKELTLLLLAIQDEIGWFLLQTNIHFSLAFLMPSMVGAKSKKSSQNPTAFMQTPATLQPNT